LQSGVEFSKFHFPVNDKGCLMAVKKRATKKRVAKKKVGAVNRQAAAIAKLRDSVKAAKAEANEAKKQVREGQRRERALLKLLESTQGATEKFLAGRIKDAVKQYGVATVPKKRKRRAKKKTAAKKG